jgi:hypothetical protein
VQNSNDLSFSEMSGFFCQRIIIWTSFGVEWFENAHNFGLVGTGIRGIQISVKYGTCSSTRTRRSRSSGEILLSSVVYNSYTFYSTVQYSTVLFKTSSAQLL